MRRMSLWSQQDMVMNYSNTSNTIFWSVNPHWNSSGKEKLRMNWRDNIMWRTKTPATAAVCKYIRNMVKTHLTSQWQENQHGVKSLLSTTTQVSTKQLLFFCRSVELLQRDFAEILQLAIPLHRPHFRFSSCQAPTLGWFLQTLDVLFWVNKLWGCKWKMACSS